MSTVEHADYPHENGTLWGCAGCEAACYCELEIYTCVHCAGRELGGES